MFGKKIISWYHLNKRNLPWRETKNPYLIWLSEIILQQTRVAQGLPYYMKFVETYKDIKTLASAEESEVLRLWQGLGYYSRARNLLATAKHISETSHGLFPNNYESLKKLKGIGSYTAAAIASFAFDQAVPAVDGNVMRVICRYFEYFEPIDSPKTTKSIFLLAKELMQNVEPSDFNQALMELGAVVCMPKMPKCNACPIADDCLARKNNTIESLPFKAKKSKVRSRYFHYAVFCNSEGAWMHERTQKDIWASLFDFYLTEDEAFSIEHVASKFSHLGEIEITPNTIHKVKHVLSHQILHITFYKIEIENGFIPGMRFYTYPEIDLLPKPIVIENYLKSTHYNSLSLFDS
jgi:A/G-specific adenine glycosylase